MKYSEEIKAFKLFNEKAEKLFQTRYVKYLNEIKKLSITIFSERDIKRDLPDQDAIDAFVLTFRLFIQKKEMSSFRYLANLYEKLPISRDGKRFFIENRNALNSSLDQKVNITIGEVTRTNKEILNIFIYGGLAHSDPKMKAIYDEWKENKIVYALLEAQFCSILEMYLRVINNVFIVNRKAIEELEKAKV